MAAAWRAAGFIRSLRGAWAGDVRQGVQWSVRHVVRHQDALCELALGTAIVVAVSWGGLTAWRFYAADLRPYARTAPRVPAARFAHASDPDEVRRMQRATDLVGEATADLAAKRWDWARSAVDEALALDPSYADAKALQRRLAAEAPPPLTPQEQAQRDRDDRVMELLGAAAAFEEADQPELAQPLLEQALALDPGQPLVLDALAELADED
jgi:tetratricopeptide (TPR) repeat protein